MKRRVNTGFGIFADVLLLLVMSQFEPVCSQVYIDVLRCLHILRCIHVQLIL